jgi:predicted ATP-dependent serine protease
MPVVGHQAVAEERDRVLGDGMMKNILAMVEVVGVGKNFLLSRAAITNVKQGVWVISAYRSSHRGLNLRYRKKLR